MLFLCGMPRSQQEGRSYNSKLSPETGQEFIYICWESCTVHLPKVSKFFLSVFGYQLSLTWPKSLYSLRGGSMHLRVSYFTSLCLEVNILNCWRSYFKYSNSLLHFIVTSSGFSVSQATSFSFCLVLETISIKWQGCFGVKFTI